MKTLRWLLVLLTLSLAWTERQCVGIQFDAEELRQSVWQRPEWKSYGDFFREHQLNGFQIFGNGEAWPWGATHSLAYPRVIKLLRDQEVRNDLDEFDSDVFEHVDQDLKPFDSRFAALVKSTTIRGGGRDVDEVIPELVELTDHLLDKIRATLTPEQRRQLDERTLLASFYDLGPLEFAGEHGGTSADLQLIERRMTEIQREYSFKLRPIYEAAIRESVKHLGSTNATTIDRMFENATMNRFGVPSLFHRELAHLDRLPRATKENYLGLTSIYRVTDSGIVKFHGRVRYYTEMEVIHLGIAAGMSKPDWKLVSNYQLARTGPIKVISSRALRDEKDELKKRLNRIDDPLEKFERELDLAELESEIERLDREEEIALVNSLSADGRERLKDARNYTAIERHGLLYVLTVSKDFRDEVGITLTDENFENLLEHRDAIMSQIQKDVVELQVDLVKTLYKDTSVAAIAKEHWITKPQGTYCPPIELLMGRLKPQHR